MSSITIIYVYCLVRWRWLLTTEGKSVPLQWEEEEQGAGREGGHTDHISYTAQTPLVSPSLSPPPSWGSCQTWSAEAAGYWATVPGVEPCRRVWAWFPPPGQTNWINKLFLVWSESHLTWFSNVEYFSCFMWNTKWFFMFSKIIWLILRI